MIDTVGAWLSTVTVTDADVVALPAASRATAVNTCDPFETAVVSHDTANGADVSSTPRLAPSSLNSTPATPTSSDAVAVTCCVPPTAEPAAGCATDTDGALLSTVTDTDADVVTFPAASRATAVNT